MPFAQTPVPPYYAVIFTNMLKTDDQNYSEMSERMLTLALQQDGCLGAESSRGADRFGITVSYWKDEKSIAAWKRNAEHMLAQELGNRQWYNHYELRVARVERAYHGPR